MQDIRICVDPAATGCAVHWDTMSERADADGGRPGNVCVNPLTWKRNGGFAPVAQHVSARCSNGELYVTHQDGGVFEPGLELPNSTNYHGLDYPLFHMDIRENVRLRIHTFEEL